jgi:hypothetical protein
MFVIETKQTSAASKMSVVMIIAAVVLKSFGGLLTLHTFVRPKPRVEGFRVVHRLSTCIACWFCKPFFRAFLAGLRG